MRLKNLLKIILHSQKQNNMNIKKFCLFLITIISFFIVGCENTAYEDKNSTNDNYLNKQISNVNKDIVPDSILERYKKEAEILTARLIQADPKLSSSLIRLPNSVIQLFTNALIQVYNANNIAARDVVIEQYNISVFPQPVTNYFYVKVDTAKLWVKKWLSGNLYTGFNDIDTLVDNYKLTVKSNLILPSATYFFLNCEESLNLLAFCNLLDDINGIDEASPEGTIGDGNNITAEIFDNYVELNYSYGFGDCPAGCISRHYWKFRIYYSGVVQFIGESGTPI